MSITLEDYLTNKWSPVRQSSNSKPMEAGYKVMDIELSSFMDRAFNGEFDYPVCI